MSHEFDILLGDRADDGDALIELTDRIGEVTTDCGVGSVRGVVTLDFTLDDSEPLGDLLPPLIGQLIDIGLSVDRVSARGDAADAEAIAEVNAALLLRSAASRPALDACILSKPVA